MISVFFQIPKLHKSGTVRFLIDTGANTSMLSEKDAKNLGIDSYMFPESKDENIGFGGIFRNRYIDCPVKLIFEEPPAEKYTITDNSGFKLNIIPSNIGGIDRLLLQDSIPSVLGTDILLKYFKIYMDKRKVELTTL